MIFTRNASEYPGCMVNGMLCTLTYSYNIPLGGNDMKASPRKRREQRTFHEMKTSKTVNNNNNNKRTKIITVAVIRRGFIYVYIQKKRTKKKMSSSPWWHSLYVGDRCIYILYTLIYTGKGARVACDGDRRRYLGRTEIYI